MKINRLGGITILAMCTLILAFIPHAKAETYLGKHCWRIGNPDYDAPIAKFNVYLKEGGDYVLSGTSDDNTVYFGNAVVIGGKLQLNMTYSGGNDPYYKNQYNMYADLDLSTFNGYYRGRGSDAKETVIIEDSMTYIKCS